MDEALENRRRSNQPPFDGTTIYLSDFVQISALRELLAPVIAILHARFPNTVVIKLKDWHEHDGYISLSQPTSWNEIQALLASEEALFLGASNGDTYVRDAFYSAGGEFLLRIFIPDEYENPYHSHDDPELVHYGLFDITCSTTLAQDIHDALLMEQAPAPIIKSEQALEFFDRRYAG